MVERLVGDLNVAMDRLLLNMAIYYEEMGDYYKAYELFLRWFNICKDLYGLQHPKTRRPINTLREPMYKRIAQEKGCAVPDMPEEWWLVCDSYMYLSAAKIVLLGFDRTQSNLTGYFI